MISDSQVLAAIEAHGSQRKACAVCSGSMRHRATSAVTCSDSCRKVRARLHRANWGMRNRDRLSDAGRAYREANADRYAEYQYKRRYGLTFSEVEGLWEAQGKACAICRDPLRLRGEKGRDKVVVDHCHDTGAVRGLLCTPCNLMIGYANDRPETLSLAIQYLGAK